MPQRYHIAFVMRLFSSQGGLELYALKLIEGLLARGHRITVICESDDSAISHENLTVHKFSSPKKGARKWQKIEHYHQVASDAVASYGPFDIVHSQHFPLKKTDAVTFHNHTASRLSFVGYPIERVVNNLKLATVRAYKLRYKYDRELCQVAAMRIFVAGVMKDDFYNTYNLAADAPYAIANPGASLGASLSASPSSTEDAKDEAVTLPNQSIFTFLFVGKGFRKKGLDTLFAACAILKARHSNFRLLIAGLKEKPLQRFQLTTQGISKEIVFLGYQKDMAAVYEQASAIILPSKMEPFGMAPIQAMQYGLVPIVSAVCGVAEVLKDNHDALILQDHLNAGELATLMQKLMDNNEFFKKLSAEATTSAKKITWEKTVEATEAAYERICKERNKEGACVD